MALMLALQVASQLMLVGASVAGTIRRHDNSGALLQTWTKALDAQSTRTTPVTRVVGLLKEMTATLTKELEDDEALYGKLACWCHNNKVEKGEAETAAQAKIAELTQSINGLSAKSSELQASLKSVEADVAANKASLAEATALREKQQKEFSAAELEAVANLQNLKAAIVVLSKHNTGLVQVNPETSDFLQAAPAGWSAQDAGVLRRALKSAAVFAQAHNSESYMPTYKAQSGEIMGVLKELESQMQDDLSAAQKTELERAQTFQQLRAAKEAEIASGEKLAEHQEDELASTDNGLAEAKEDLAQEQATLDETQKFLNNLGGTCDEAEKNFNTRKAARQDEIQAVSETIAILQQDSARDTMTRTYNFFQTAASSVEADAAAAREVQVRRQASLVLKKVAAQVHNPVLSALATSVELDSFAKVKETIDNMIKMLNTQQADEVQKNDWCIQETQQNAMDTSKKTSAKEDLDAKAAALAEKANSVTESIATAKGQISQLQLELQRASEARMAENHEFQRSVADQQVVVQVLGMALNRLADYYDNAALLQKSKAQAQQTPPVAQMDYQPSKSAPGVMQMIEKLIQEAKELTAKARASENEAQVAYEATVADTNEAVATLAKQVATSSKVKAQVDKDAMQTNADIASRVVELEELAKYKQDLDEECNFVVKNFETRQTARAQEIEALQQARQILSGASLS